MIRSEHSSWLDDPHRSLSWNRQDALALATLGLGVAIGIFRFWQPGIASDADMLMAIYRIFDLHEAWRQGVFYPRISPNLNFGYGAPLFQYYPPLASYIAILFVSIGIGYVEAAKLTFTLALALGGLGAYVYARWLFNHRIAAWLAGIAFIFSPYFLLNIYERGALSETVGMALLPWLFYSLHRLLYQPDLERLIIATALIAMSITAHNVTALFTVPASIFFVAGVAIFDRRLQKTVYPLLALLLGFTLSAFYWVPAIGELHYSRAAEFMTSIDGVSTVSRHLVGLSELFQSGILAAYAGPDRFRFGLLPALLVGLSILTLFLLPRFPRSRVVALAMMAALFVIILLAQLNDFKVLWEGLPLVRFIQFSWRLYGLASLAAALLIGALLCLPFPFPGYRFFAAVGIAVSLMFTAVYRLSPEFIPGWYLIDSRDITKTSLFERGRQGYALYTDYTPASLKLPVEQLTTPRQSTEPTFPRVPIPKLNIRKVAPNFIELNSESADSYPLRIHRTYFPGWKAFVDGQEVPVVAEGGQAVVTAMIPEGHHEVVFRFEHTLLRKLAVSASWLISGVIVSMILWLAFVRHRLALLIVVAATLVALSTSFHGTSKRQNVNDVKPVNIVFGDQLFLRGYNVNNTSLRGGDEIFVKFIWWIPETPSADYTIFMHLVRADDTSSKITQRDEQPMLGFSPMTRWESGELVDDLHILHIPEGTPPGEYLVLVGLYHPYLLTNLSITGDGEILPGDRFVLAQVSVQ
ncbi:6-pyruvoyl-tetrahydropterin synthase-related protein [Caldilinea sp.]|jgi:hypothetical protein|uniref:6-pyruvoyl-tetrahydropterin synthase-related protein n=1 Tax=Caldilinea sp. TaxID=2293560 RepID=UPI0021DF225B|nr:6-pyruvoyl-tetrahydropterin synthase-related protein [Caldilinea sp.]GIV69746.1 MAG: hypothetical protein KatS3mg048_2608 [Caldilinea sp.]